MEDFLKYERVKPATVLQDYVESFWQLENTSPTGKNIVVVPDGRIDLFLSYSVKQGFHITLSGLETEPDSVNFEGNTKIFAISFRLLAVEYLLQTSIADLTNDIRMQPSDFWDFSETDLENFHDFCEKANRKMAELLSLKKIDERKLRLFHLINLHQGEITVHELAEKAGWSERQINRYFNDKFGLSLKKYCNILRFRASFGQIKEGKLFPELNFTDQAHFIREIKKFSGVTPKELTKNPNDRFIQFSTLPKQ